MKSWVAAVLMVIAGAAIMCCGIVVPKYDMATENETREGWGAKQTPKDLDRAA